MRRDVFQAIADPTRREIISMIAHQSLNVNTVAGNFDVSRTAIYKHVKILTECGLVVVRQQGRERYCEARLDKLHEVSDWVGQYREFWNARLNALEQYLNAVQPLPAHPGATESRATHAGADKPHTAQPKNKKPGKSTGKSK